MREHDQAPSIHVIRSRQEEFLGPPPMRGSMLHDPSERSFQSGIDPIERDWDDSRSHNNPNSRRGT